MECSTDELELAKRRVGAQIQTLRDEMERQFKRTLTQTVDAHENDRKSNFERYLTRASLEYPPEIFERLKSWLRCQFPSYISGFHYFQGGSFSINFTNTPPPGAWEPILVDMNKMFDQVAIPATNVQKNMAALASSHSSDSRPSTPSRMPLATNSRSSPRTKPPRQKKAAVLPTSRVKKSQLSDQRPRPTPPKPKRHARKSSERVEGGPIRTSYASKRVHDYMSWAFSYNLGEGDHYYILQCPTPGCQFSFSLNPLRNNMAVTHFKECNVPFFDEADIVRRYARRLYSRRSNLEETDVSEIWVENFNQEVLRGRKQRRRKEGRSASKALEVVDGSSTASPEMSPRETELIQG
ncbi:hypothetical protein LZ30DRAFT_592367 [Colletotrichum cereale]|nr:hypothetical protein LZ30DRAFT_592367 [Colletotrichum cereale]